MKKAWNRNVELEFQDKCAKYWPSKSDARQDEFLSYGEVQVCLASESVLAHYIIRILKVQMVWQLSTFYKFFTKHNVRLFDTKRRVSRSLSTQKVNVLHRMKFAERFDNTISLIGLKTVPPPTWRAF